MGYGRFTSTDWDSFTAHRTAGRSRDDVFSRGLRATMDPRLLAAGVRESRDSPDNPDSTPVIVGLDVTGSMGMIAEAIARHGLRTLFESIYSRQPVPDPHIMFMGVGDATCDQAPLQVSQFEADIRIAEQLVDLWLEGGGGGNSSESYTLPWLFAALHTATDAWSKRGRKGYLFTIGDEEPPEVLTAREQCRVLGQGRRDLYTPDVLRLVRRQWEVFHIIVEQGSHCQSGGLDRVVRKWTGLLGQRALRLQDYTRLPEVIVSAMQVNEGRNLDDVAASWGGSTADVVRHAMRPGAPPEARRPGLLRLLGR
ncbi:MAG TPA: hypothetical protein VGC15_15040 [Acetobacteraceae bacterium]